MYSVILIVLVSVSARSDSQIYNNEPLHDGYERPFVNPPIEINHRNGHGDVNYNTQNGYSNLNHQEFRGDSNDRRWNSNPNEFRPNHNYHGQLQEPNNRELVSRDRDGRTRNGNRNEDIPYRQKFVLSDMNDRIRNENQNQGPPDRQFYEPNNRQFISSEKKDRRRSENPHEQFGGPNIREFVPSNTNDRGLTGNANLGQIRENINNQRQLNMQNNRDLYDNKYNNRNYNTQAHSNDNTGSMDINLAFDRRENHNAREHSNLNMPRQSFNVNNEYSNRDITNNSTSRSNNRNDRYNQNILNARRRQDEMTLGDYNRGNDNPRNTPETQSNVNIVTFLNKLINSTNQNSNRVHRNSGFRQADQRTKAVIENEVTEIPLENDDKENRTLDKDDWVWGMEETTTLSPVTLDDRAAFSGDQCPTGYARFHGMCVPKD